MTQQRCMAHMMALSWYPGVFAFVMYEIALIKLSGYYLFETK